MGGTPCPTQGRVNSRRGTDASAATTIVMMIALVHAAAKMDTVVSSKRKRSSKLSQMSKRKRSVSTSVSASELVKVIDSRSVI